MPAIPAPGRTSQDFSFNEVTGTANDLQLSINGTSPSGNTAIYGISQGSVGTVGAKIGVFGEANTSSTLNLAVGGKAVWDTSGVTNIGMAGFATSTGGTHVGGYFGLHNSTRTFTSAALIADNGAKTDLPQLGYLTGIPIKDYTVINSGERKTGVIAQELLADYSELVSMGDDGYYKVAEVSSWKIIEGISRA
jgi:hypothetical protein